MNDVLRTWGLGVSTPGSQLSMSMEPVEVLEDSGDMVMGAGVGEEAGSGVFDTNARIEGSVFEFF